METNYLVLFIGVWTIMALVSALIVVFIAFLKSRSLIKALENKAALLNDKLRFLNIITNGHNVKDNVDDEENEVIAYFNRLSFEVINYYCVKIILYYKQKILDYNIFNIGCFVDKIESMEVVLSGRSKRNFLIELFEKALSETDIKYLAKIFVESIEYDICVGSLIGSGTNNAHVIRGRKAIWKILIKDGNHGETASSFVKEFDNGIAVLLAKKEIDEDNKKIIVAESVKFHKLLGY